MKLFTILCLATAAFAQTGPRQADRQTPWGVAHAKATDAVVITAVEADGVVRFSRLGPFGTYRWTKREAELTVEEKAALVRARADASNTKPRQEQQ